MPTFVDLELPETSEEEFLDDVFVDALEDFDDASTSTGTEISIHVDPTTSEAPPSARHANTKRFALTETYTFKAYLFIAREIANMFNAFKQIPNELTLSIAEQIFGRDNSWAYKNKPKSQGLSAILSASVQLALDQKLNVLKAKLFRYKYAQSNALTSTLPLPSLDEITEQTMKKVISDHQFQLGALCHPLFILLNLIAIAELTSFENLCDTSKDSTCVCLAGQPLLITASRFFTPQMRNFSKDYAEFALGVWYAFVALNFGVDILARGAVATYVATENVFAGLKFVKESLFGKILVSKSSEPAKPSEPIEAATNTLSS